MYQEQQTIETGNAKLVGEFYYSLALLQSQAINYVAFAGTDDDKLTRIKEIIELVKKTGMEIPRLTVPNHGPEHCFAPCREDKLLMMCICDEPSINP